MTDQASSDHDVQHTNTQVEGCRDTAVSHVEDGELRRRSRVLLHPRRWKVAAASALSTGIAPAGTTRSVGDGGDGRGRADHRGGPKDPRRNHRAVTAAAVIASAAALVVAGGVVGRETAGTGSDSPIRSQQWGQTARSSSNGWTWHDSGEVAAGRGAWSGSSYGWSQTEPRLPDGWEYARPGRSPYRADQTPTGGSSATQPTGTAGATSAQLRGMVRIVATSAYESSTAAGTGMVLSRDGEVVTNNHVVAGATRIRATVMSTGRTYDVRLLGTNVKDDVAVLQLLDASGLDPVATATQAVTKGEKVTAVGDADGTPGHLTAATGTVTAADRSITTTNENGSSTERLQGLIEIAAAVVPGDSGGAVLDSDARVVGMTTAASTGSAAVTGYAIPISSVRSVVEQVDSGRDTAKIRIGYGAFLGVGLEGSGTVVTDVIAGTPASRVGLVGGDEITSVDGQETNSVTQLDNVIAAHRPGDAVRLQWTTPSGAVHVATVKLMRAPAA